MTTHEILPKREFRRMINSLIEENGGEMRLSKLYSYLRKFGFYHRDIIDNLVSVGIIVDEVADVASLEPRPIQCTLDVLNFFSVPAV